MITKQQAPRQLSDSVFWLGATDTMDFLQVNIYLIYRDGQGILIDPGPRSIFKETLRAVKEIVPIEGVTAMVVSNQDPDVCSSLPLWEEAGFQGQLITHWRTGLFINSYGLLSPLYNIKKNETERFNELRFITVPYMHSPGVIMTYDEASGSLFSSDLFGAFGKTENLFSNDAYLRKMIFYHNNFMPFAGDVIKALDEFEQFDLSRICPQHGCVIEENPMFFISELKEHFRKIDAKAVIPESIDEMEADDLEKLRFKLNEELVLSSDENLVDPVTGLYNTSFFMKYLPEFIDKNDSGTIVYFRIDGMKSFNNIYGYQEGDIAIATFASILQAEKPEDALLFRDSGPILILMLPDSYRDNNITVIGNLQNKIRESGEFIQDMTCSAVVAKLAEVDPEEKQQNDKFIWNIRRRLQLLDRMGTHSIYSYSEKKASDSGAENSVLIIDSDPVYNNIVRDYFEEKRFSVHVCTAGADALQKIDLLRPDVIVSEIQVPQVDGFRLRERLLQSGDLRNIPFLFLSHLKTEASVRRAHKLGVMFNLKKPVMLSELNGIISSLIDKEQANDG